MTILVVEVYHVLFHNLAEKWRGGWRVTSGGRGIWIDGSCQLITHHCISKTIKRVILRMGKTVLITGANRGYVLPYFSHLRFQKSRRGADADKQGRARIDQSILGERMENHSSRPRSL
jgi:hypothetical protein